jgi:hypothetical protein
MRPHVLRVADETALQFAYLRVEARERHELLLDRLPVGQRIDEQAAVGIGGDDEVPAAARGEYVAKPGRHRQPPLAVEIQMRGATKHECPLLRGKTRPLTFPGCVLSHFSPLLPTILERKGGGQGLFGRFLFIGQ